jgi:hypothetical protein
VNTLDQTVTWEDPPGGGHAFEHLRRELEEDGWEEVGDAPAEPDDSMRRVLEKGGERRALALETGDDVTRLVLSLKG